jgi:hypothetical protein
MRTGCCPALAFLVIDSDFAPARRQAKLHHHDSTPAKRGALRFLQSDAL